MKPKGSSFKKKSSTLHPPIFEAADSVVLPAINFRSKGFRSFSNLGLMLTIASKALEFCFSIGAILVLALMIIWVEFDFMNAFLLIVYEVSHQVPLQRVVAP